MKTKASLLGKSMNRSHVRLAFLLIPLACLALSPQARATCLEGCLTNENTDLGDDALLNNVAFDNTAVGFQTLYTNTIGFNNTATGFHALFSNSTGDDNTATGSGALENNTTGSDNTAYGVEALFSNTTGSDNTAVGFQTLYSNTIGFNNTANGSEALHNNTTGSSNTANGVQALFTNTTGSSNTANGNLALISNTTGSSNTANGMSALGLNQTGSENTANGGNALLSNTTGNHNTATGFRALQGNTTGSYNVALGFKAGFDLTTGDRNIDVGNAGVAGDSNTIRIGREGDQTATFIAGISRAIVPTGVPVIVDGTGHLGVTTSSARFKEEIESMDKASEAILALKPVTFRYKRELDPRGVPQFGLVAEDVEKVNPDLVAHDEQGKPYTVRYEAVNAMLLNEFLKEHCKNEKQEATIADLKAEIATLSATVREQSAQIQKVSARLELSHPAPETVVNNQ